MTVLFGRPGEFEASFAYGVVRQLLGPGLAGDDRDSLARRPRGRRGARSGGPARRRPGVRHLVRHPRLPLLDDREHGRRGARRDLRGRRALGRPALAALPLPPAAADRGPACCDGAGAEAQRAQRPPRLCSTRSGSTRWRRPWRSIRSAKRRRRTSCGSASRHRPMRNSARPAIALARATPSTCSSWCEPSRRRRSGPAATRSSAWPTCGRHPLPATCSAGWRGHGPEAASLASAMAVLGDGATLAHAGKVAGLEAGDASRAGSGPPRHGRPRGRGSRAFLPPGGARGAGFRPNSGSTRRAASHARSPCSPTMARRRSRSGGICWP